MNEKPFGTGRDGGQLLILDARGASGIGGTHGETDPRGARGAVYHVTARGSERRRVFRDEPDRPRFVDTPAECADRRGVLRVVPRVDRAAGRAPSLRNRLATARKNVNV